MKAFVHLSEYGHIRVISLAARQTLWKLIYQEDDDQYSDWRANEVLPNYTLEEFLALTDEELYNAIEYYTQGRGWPAIVEVEE